MPRQKGINGRLRLEFIRFEIVRINFQKVGMFVLKAIVKLSAEIEIKPGLTPNLPGLRLSHPGLKPEAWLAVWALGLAGWASGLAGWASSLAGWPRVGTNKQTYKHTNIQTYKNMR